MPWVPTTLSSAAHHAAELASRTSSPPTPHDPPTYLTWLIRQTPGGCTIRLEIDEVDSTDSREDAEDVWLPVLAALQHLLNPV
jgi:hypothetical protein